MKKTQVENKSNQKGKSDNMTFEQIVSDVRKQFQTADTSDISGVLAIQVNLTGKQEGTFYVEVKEGILSVEPYEYIDRNVMITLSDENFLKIISGKLDPVSAFMTGKLKADGDVEKALELKRFIKN